MNEERKTFEQRTQMTDTNGSVIPRRTYWHFVISTPESFRGREWNGWENRDMDGRAERPSERARASQISK
jgi:hypothetical protein